jgi:exodeoxyribonuclease V alpha subunit
LSGETLHRLLRYNPAGNTFLYNSENPLPSRVVIVDEVSMADVEMMNRLLQAMSTGEGSKLVLLGDPDQLPSVQSGAVLSSLVLSGAEREGRMQNHAALKEAFRSGEDILRLASKVNAGEPEEHREALEEILGKNKVPPGQGFDREEGVFRCTPQNQDTSELQALLENWVRVHYRGKYREMVKSIGKECDFGHLSEGDAASLREIFELMEGVQILSLNRKGTFGVEYMNRVCAGIYSGRENGGAIFAGAPIMITANDHYHKLFNGERGIILEDKNGAQYAFFTSLEGFVKFPVHSLPHFELAYAITVHKSQGSGYSKVLMVFPEDRANRLLNRQIFYTGITRAKKYLCIYGKQEILRLAMERKIQRESGPLLIR